MTENPATIPLSISQSCWGDRATALGARDRHLDLTRVIKPAVFEYSRSGKGLNIFEETKRIDYQPFADVNHRNFNCFVSLHALVEGPDAEDGRVFPNVILSLPPYPRLLI
jgi:hypothetical protein